MGRFSPMIWILSSASGPASADMMRSTVRKLKSKKSFKIVRWSRKKRFLRKAGWRQKLGEVRAIPHKREIARYRAVSQNEKTAAFHFWKAAVFCASFLRRTFALYLFQEVRQYATFSLIICYRSGNSELIPMKSSAAKRAR